MFFFILDIKHAMSSSFIGVLIAFTCLLVAFCLAFPWLLVLPTPACKPSYWGPSPDAALSAELGIIGSRGEEEDGEAHAARGRIGIREPQAAAELVQL